MRSLAKRSGSKMSISKSSMNHMGTVPYKYKVDVFVSYVDVVKTAGEVCVTWERRGKSNATASVKVKDKKAVFKEALSMETTLFRKPPPKGASESDDYKFDEKIAKFALRKGNADGKALGKMHINLADHIKGPTGTVFADLKLSNGSIIVTKIESLLLHTGKKAKKAGSGGSEACSEMTDMDGGMEDDSIFGDDAPDDLGDLDLMIDEAGAGDGGSSSKAPAPAPAAPVSQKAVKSVPKEEPKAPAKSPKASHQASSAASGDSATPKSSKKDKTFKSDKGKTEKGDKVNSEKAGKPEKGDVGLTQSPSIRDKLKSKMKKDKTSTSKKEKSGDDGERKGESSSSKDSSAKISAEVAQLREAVTSLTAENRKLRTSKQAMMEEIEELRSELESSEQALEEMQESGVSSMGGSMGTSESTLRQDKKDMQAQIKELEGQVEGLLDELDGNEDGRDGVKPKGKKFDDEDYKKQIVDLELALKREPQYLDVVDELKVAKMSLALANMEKEQAVFALKRYEAGKDVPHSPMSPGPESPRRNESGWGLGMFG